MNNKENNTRNVNLIFERLMAALGLTTNKELADRLGVGANTLSNWKKRDSLDYEKLFTICELNNLSIDSILYGAKRSSLVPVFKESHDPYSKNGQMPKVISVSPEGDENIIMVPVPAQAGYLNGFGDPEYLESLPSYRLPTLNNGTFRIFEVKGHSMYPTIHSGALAVGEWCENWEEDIKDNQIYIIVSKEDGIVVKRCLNRLKKYNNLYLKSDNRREYPSYPIKPEDILEVWTLKTAFIYDFQDPADMYDRVSDLEARLMHVETQLPRTSK